MIVDQPSQKFLVLHAPHLDPETFRKAGGEDSRRLQALEPRKAAFHSLLIDSQIRADLPGARRQKSVLVQAVDRVAYDFLLLRGEPGGGELLHHKLLDGELPVCHQRENALHVDALLRLPPAVEAVRVAGDDLLLRGGLRQGILHERVLDLLILEEIVQISHRHTEDV